MSGASHFALAAGALGDGRAPCWIHAAISWISSGLRAGLPSGIRGAVEPFSLARIRLPALLPGFTQAPLRPPFSTSSYVARDSPPDRFSWLWHSRHRAARIVWTSRLKSIIAGAVWDAKRAVDTQKNIRISFESSRPGIGF